MAVNYTNDHPDWEAQSLLFQQGDEQALSRFFHEFYPALTRYSSKWIENRSTAEDIVSNAFVKTWKMNWKLDNYGAIRAYLYKIVQRDSITALRKEKKMKLLPVEIFEEITNANTPFDHMVRTEVYRILHTALKEISPCNRKVLIMHYLDGKTTGQIARELKLHRSTINTQKMKGLKALRKKLLPRMCITLLSSLKYFLPLGSTFFSL